VQARGGRRCHHACSRLALDVWREQRRGRAAVGASLLALAQRGQAV